MKIVEKFNAKAKDLNGAPPVTIAFLGDSVTQGCFDVYEIREKAIETYFDAENAYHTKFRKIMNMLYPNVPINIINAGISGGNSIAGFERLERDVLKFSPDLCVVCFGLNDCGHMEAEQYKEYMGKIFDKLLENGIEVIFLTPNMMCTEVSCHIDNTFIRGIAENVSLRQNSGRLETFLEEAKKVAKERNIPVCDCYAKWKVLYESGVNITELLANHINHPTADMNWMFAYSLVETMFS